MAPTNCRHSHARASPKPSPRDKRRSTNFAKRERERERERAHLNLRLDVVVVVAEEVRPRASHDGDVIDPLVPLHDLLVHGRRLRPTALEGPRHRVVVVHHVHALAALPHLSRKVDRVLFGVGIGVGDDANTVVRDGINKIK